MVFSKQLSSEILINSSAKRLWELITDFEDFPRWNPFIRKATGEIKTGARLEVFIQPFGTRGMTFRPKVLKVDPNHELRWLGRLYLPWLFEANTLSLLNLQAMVPSSLSSVRSSPVYWFPSLAACYAILNGDLKK